MPSGWSSSTSHRVSPGLASSATWPRDGIPAWSSRRTPERRPAATTTTSPGTSARFLTQPLTRSTPASMQRVSSHGRNTGMVTSGTVAMTPPLAPGGSSSARASRQVGTASVHHRSAAPRSTTTPSRTATPLSGSRASAVNRSSVTRPQSSTRARGSTWYGNQRPPATADVVSPTGSSRTQRTTWPARARLSADVKPMTPPPTTVTRAMPASSSSVGEMDPLDRHPITGELFASPVPAGSGWPGDPADASTPVATTPAAVRRLAASSGDVPELQARVSVCRACPRLVRWREDVARSGRRASFADQPYWGRPGPSFGDLDADVLLVGLAPAANGTNRTGRMFTGDSSGDVLYAALHRTGFARLPTSVAAGDGQALTGIRIVAAVRCAPPANKPTPTERATCSSWLER